MDLLGSSSACLQHKGWVEGLGCEKSRQILLPVAKVAEGLICQCRLSGVIAHGIGLQAEGCCQLYTSAGHRGDLCRVGWVGLGLGLGFGGSAISLN